MKANLEKVKASIGKNKLVVLGVALCMLAVLNSVQLPQAVHYTLSAVISCLVLGFSIGIIREGGTTWTKK
ncbi:MAG: hypothetical protein ACRCTE_03370 [Cellulosilyticaceae bacterium]